MELRKSACSFVSTPSAMICTPIHFAMRTTDSMMLPLRPVRSSPDRNIMSSFSTSAGTSLSTLKEE